MNFDLIEKIILALIAGSVGAMLTFSYQKKMKKKEYKVQVYVPIQKGSGG